MIVSSTQAFTIDRVISIQFNSLSFFHGKALKSNIYIQFHITFITAYNYIPCREEQNEEQFFLTPALIEFDVLFPLLYQHYLSPLAK